MFTDDIEFLQKAVVFHPKKKGVFLALKRSADSFTFPSRWDLPGGNVLYGELHDESLRKEIDEEASLRVGKLSPAQVVTTYDREKKIYVIFNGFYCQAKSDVVKISDEHSEFRWVTKEEFIKLKPIGHFVKLLEDVFRVV